MIYFATNTEKSNKMVLMLLPRPLTDEEQEVMADVHKDVDGESTEVGSFEVKYCAYDHQDEGVYAIVLIPNDPNTTDDKLRVTLRHVAAIMLLPFTEAQWPTEYYFLTTEFILHGPETEVDMMWKTLN
jgi:hypothetical protein